MSFLPIALKRRLHLKPNFFHIKLNKADNELGIFSENKFRELLGLEIKRISRSGRQFFLMLFHIEKLTEKSDSKKTIKKIITEITKNTRNIDIKGWYEHARSIGIILTETNGFSPDFVLERLNQKINKKLCTVLNHSQLAELKISFKVYPENNGKNNSKNSSNVRLTPNFIPQSAANQKNEGLINDSSEAIGNDKKKIFESKWISSGSFNQRLLLICGDIFIIFLANFFSVWFRFGNFVNVINIYTGACALSLFFYVCALYVFDLYNMARDFQSRESMVRAVMGVFLGGGLTVCVFYLIPQWQLGRGIFFIQIFLLGGLFAGWRILFGYFFQKNIYKKNALILGTGKSGREICRLLSAPFSPYQIKGFLDNTPSNYGQLVGATPVLGTIDQLDKVSQTVWISSAILATSRNSSPEMIRKVLDARFQGLEVLEAPTVYERLTGRVPVCYIEDQWLLFAEGFYLISKEYIQKLKRLMDIFVSGSMLLCSFPLMALTALLIRIDSPGPVFYRQERVGKNGKVFRVVKFRSMFQDAESSGAKWCEEKDSRITRVGHWIRKFRIDELPQIWNVFKGDMSLIGPRPERPEFVKDLETIIPYYGTRHAVAPGISGWAQVNYPYGASVEDSLHKLEFDLYYIKNMSLFLDFKITLKTIGVILLGDGAR